jgi:thioredoxin reductase
MWNTIALEAKGDGDLLQAVRIKNTKTGEEKDLPANGLFFAIGDPEFVRRYQHSLTKFGSQVMNQQPN